MQNKRGQITIFVISGILILLVAGILFYFLNIKPAGVEPVPEVSTEALPVKVFIGGCLKNTAEEGLKLIGMQGGYYNVPNASVSIYFTDVPYYYESNKTLVPTNEEVEAQISMYMNDELDKCFGNFSAFGEQGYIITSGDGVISARIMKGEVSVRLSKKILVEVDNKRAEISQFVAKLDSSLYDILELAGSIVDSYLAKEGYICITCIDDLSSNLVLDTKFMPHFDPNNPELKLYRVIIQDHKGAEDYVFRFVLEMTDKQEFGVSAVDLQEFENMSILIGYGFDYSVKASGENLKFFDNTELFDINPDSGLISFIPEQADVGEYLIKIAVSDDKGNSDYSYLPLKIEGFNNNPKIGYIGYKTAKINSQFVYYVNATDIDNDGIVYSDDTDLFDISASTGLISFTPKSGQEGDYKITLAAIDSRGGKDTEIMDLLITG